jgi:hypothetical protein
MKALVLTAAMLASSTAFAQTPIPAGADAPAAPPGGPAPAPAPAPAPKADEWKPTLKVSGLIVPQWLHEFRTDAASKIGSDQFVLSRARIGARGEILPKLEYRVTYALESGSETIWDALKDSYLEYSAIPHHEIRFGKFKTPFGYEQPESEVRLLPINRSYVTSSLGKGEDSRDIGAGVWGDWDLTDVVAAEYALALVNGNFAEDESTVDDLPQKNLFARAGVRARLAGGTLTGHGSYSQGNVSSNATQASRLKVTRAGADVTYDHKRLWVAAEYIAGTDENLAGAETDKAGWYALVAPRFPWSGGVTSVMLRYEVYDKNTDSAARDDVRKRVTYGLVHDLNPKVRIMANFEDDHSDLPVAKPDKVIFQTLVSF